MGKKVTDIPHMIKMWDFKLNTDEPEQVSVNLEEKRYWKCPDCGYSWSSLVKGRYRSSGKCPCHESNKVIVKGINDVLTIVKGLPELLDENNDIDLISHQGVDSSVRVNLHCKECGRKWTVMLKSQIKKDEAGGYIVTGCPHYNTIKRKKDNVPFCNEVKSIYRFWDDDNALDPFTTKANSCEKVHFICKNCAYDWTTSIRSQSRGTGKCKCCELQRITKKGYTDIFTLIPEAKLFYNFSKNKDIDIYSISLRNSDILIDWKCPDCGYEWQSPLASRINGKKGSYSFRGCHQCYLHGIERITPIASVPKLVSYWDYKKNENIDIHLTSAHSHDSANWKCKECGYAWTETIKGFNGRKDSCPLCEGKQAAIMKGVNDALTICPELASIYDFEANKRNGIDIYSLSPNSKIKANFRCKKCGYKWISPIRNRIKLRNKTHVFVDCPKCSNKVLRQIPYSKEFPELSKMYRTDLNHIPIDSIKGAEAISHTNYFWDCPICGETFASTLNAMKSSINSPTRGCPYCSHTKLRKGESFADLHPEIMKEYAPENKIDAYNEFPNSGKSVMWICKDCGYKWEATFALRHIGGGNCHICNRTQLIGEINSFAAIYPDMVKYWSKNNTRKADEVFYNSTEWFNFICPTCGEEHGSFITDFLSEENHCPYCRGIRLNSKVNSLKVLYPHIANRWSKNNEINSDQILPTAFGYYKWICDTCHGEYGAPVKDVVAGIDECPYCNGTKVLAGFNSLSVVNPNLANLVSPLNKLDAKHILPSKKSMQLWRCNNCNGDYYASTYNMENGYECPYCNDRLLLKGFNSFGDKHPNLLNEMDEIANYLLPYTAYDVLDTSSKKFWWVCKKNTTHKYSMSPQTRLMFEKRHREPCLYCRGQRRKLNHFVSDTKKP